MSSLAGAMVWLVEQKLIWKKSLTYATKVVENGKITGGYFGKSRWNDVMGCIVASQWVTVFTPLILHHCPSRLTSPCDGHFVSNCTATFLSIDIWKIHTLQFCSIESWWPARRPSSQDLMPSSQGLQNVLHLSSITNHRLHNVKIYLAIGLRSLCTLLTLCIGP